MSKIKDASIIFLIVFIIASTLYAIHMFRYELVIDDLSKGIIRYDRITNTQCYSALPHIESPKQIDKLDMKLVKEDGKINMHGIRPCNNIDGKAIFGLPEKKVRDFDETNF